MEKNIAQGADAAHSQPLGSERFYAEWGAKQVVQEELWNRQTALERAIQFGAHRMQTDEIIECATKFAAFLKGAA